MDSFVDKTPLIAILRGITPKDIQAVAQGLIEYGFDSIEVPLNSPNAFDSIELLSQVCQKAPRPMLYGAGTVTDLEEVDRLVQTGANLMVTPNCDTDVIKSAKAQQLITAIGCLTPTECFSALQAGADAIKIFPATAMPKGYIKQIKEVLPQGTKVFAVGGVAVDNLGDFFDQKADGVGIGGSLYKANMSVDQVLGNAKAFAKAYANLKS